MTVLVVFS